MNKSNVVWLVFLALALTLLAGCGSSQALPPPAPLNAGSVNLIFVVSPDLAYQAPGDVNTKTANLTNQGLQRSLPMATFLQHQVLGTQNVTGIYTLEPMTHLQTANNYPDMTALETIQQFAMLNQITLSSDPQSGTPYTGQSFPINASYALGPLPIGVAAPPQFCPNCQGLDFNDDEGDNEALLTTIVKNNAPGFYIFSAPWETVSALMANINKLEHYNWLFRRAISVPTLSMRFRSRRREVPGCQLRQPPDPALHLPGAAPAVAGQHSMHGADAFQDNGDRRSGWRRDSSGNQH